MKSKKSFFDKSLFKFNIKRYWLIWASIALIMCVVPAYIFNEATSLIARGKCLAPKDITYMYREIAVYAVPWMAFFSSGLVGGLIWNYLYTQRSVGFFHTIPVSRNKLFFTNYISGLSILLIPYCIAGLITIIVIAAFGAGVPLATFQLMFCVLCMTVLFYSISTIAAHITGNAFGMVALYLTINFVVSFITYVGSRAYCRFVIGVYNASVDVLDFFSPLVYLVTRVNLDGDDPHTYIQSVLRTNTVIKSWMGSMGAFIVYGIIGIALFFFAMYLYSRRKSEVAGDFAAFKPLRPAYIAIFSVVGGLALASIIIMFFFSSLEDNPYVFLVVSFISVAIAYYVSKMIIEKSFAVFTKKSLKGLVALWVAFGVFTAAAGTDVFKVAYSHPDISEIDWVGISTNGMYYDLKVDGNDELVNACFEMQKVMADNAKEIERRNIEYSSDYNNDFYLFIRYHEKKATEFERDSRTYNLKIFEEDLKDPNSFGSKYVEFLNSRILYKAMLEPCEKYQISSSNIYASGSQDLCFDVTLFETGAKELYDAIVKDIDEGAMEKRTLEELKYDTPITVYFDLIVPREDRIPGRYEDPENIGINITAEMTNALKVIEKASHRSEEDLSKLFKEYYDSYSKMYSEEYYVEYEAY